MAHFSEMSVRRRLINEFIRQESLGSSGKVEVVIPLIRTPQILTDNGGVRPGVPETLPSQVFALQPFKRRQTEEIVFTAPSMGRDQTTDVQYLLIGSFRSDILKGDEFRWTSEEQLRPGLYVVEYVAIRQSDHKIAGIRYDGQLV